MLTVCSVEFGLRWTVIDANMCGRALLFLPNTAAGPKSEVPESP